MFVIHDRDGGKEKAEQFNPIILESLNSDETRLCVLENCVEDILGYKPPSKDKPYHAFKFTKNWTEYGEINEEWKNVIEKALAEYL